MMKKIFSILAITLFVLCNLPAVADQTLVYDDFEDGIIDTSKWIIESPAIVSESGGNLLLGKDFSNYYKGVRSIAATPALGTKDTVVLSSSYIDYPNYSKYVIWGLDQSANFSQSVVLWTDTANSYVLVNGVQKHTIASGLNSLHGPTEIRLSANKIVVKLGGTVVFDSDTQTTDNAGNPWIIPSPASQMHIWMTKPGYLDSSAAIQDVSLEVVTFDSMEVSEPKFRAVYQRNNSNVAFVPVNGIYPPTPALNSIQARYVIKNDPCVAGRWEDISFSNGSFDDTITIPAGGWYDIEIKALSGQTAVYNAVIQKVGIGEVFITSGQSNSVNSCNVKVTPSEDIISAWTWNDGWQHATDPQPTPSIDFGGVGGSVWSRLGSLLVAEYNVPVAFITTGYAGSRVDQWLPTSPKQLYPRIEQALDAAGSNGVRAILWHQGEQDSYDHTTMTDYTNRLTTIITATRQYAGWQVPWGIAIAAYPGDAYYVPAYVQAINDAQRYVTDTLPAAFEGPYTDDLIGVGIYRLADSVHFNDAGRNQHALRWKDAIIKRINKGDFEPDGDIDLADFADFLYKWLEIDCGSCDYADLNDDGKVDLADFTILGNNWLTTY